MLLKELGIWHFYVILKELDKGEKTISQLMNAYKSSRLYEKLRVLEKHGMISTREKREGRTRFKIVAMTRKGKILLQLMEQINTLGQKE